MNKLTVKNLNFSYFDDKTENKILKEVNAEFESGKVYAIVGESGSGKTTLISLISALDKLQDGDILWNDKSIKDIGNQQFRLKYVNIVFQSYNLINYMTAKENVDVAIDFAGIKNKNGTKSYEILESLNINKTKADRPILRLSGGEQQRVAIARCIASDEPIIVADEPTGNLDKKTETNILDIFYKLAHEQDKCVIIVTHSQKVANMADVIYEIDEGKLLITNKI
jgi:ABC-type antimicrobial peptide transport system, ATPase component